MEKRKISFFVQKVDRALIQSQTQTDASLFIERDSVPVQRVLRQTKETLLHFIGFQFLDVNVVIILADKSVVFSILLNLSN